MSLRLRAAATGAVALLLAGAAVPAAAQEPPRTTDRTEAAAGWLARNLVDGERLEVAFGDDVFPDHGGTVDAVLGLAAAGVSDDAAAAATSWLERSDNTEAYSGDGTASVWAGPTAKLAVLAQVRGLDPTSWGEDDVDLIQRLLDREQPDGRFADLNPWSPEDYANSIGQSFAIVALLRQPGVDPSAESIDSLLTLQCDDGGFKLAYDEDGCSSSADTTAFAVQALLAVGRDAEAAEALDYLEATQDEQGAWGTPGPEGPNANTAGVGGWALAVGGRDDAAGAAAAFVRSLQAGCDAPEEDRGAIAYDEDGLDDRAPRATAQAVLALAPVALVDLTAAGNSAAAPLLDDCPPGPPQPGPGVTAPPEPEDVVAVGAPGPAAAAAPVAAVPTFTG